MRISDWSSAVCSSDLVGVEHADHRDVQVARLVDGNVLLVGVDHEEHVRQAAHLLDAAQRALQLVALAGEVQQLLLGEADLAPLGELLLDRAQALDRIGADRKSTRLTSSHSCAPRMPSSA